MWQDTGSSSKVRRALWGTLWALSLSLHSPFPPLPPPRAAGVLFHQAGDDPLYPAALEGSWALIPASPGWVQGAELALMGQSPAGFGFFTHFGGHRSGRLRLEQRNSLLTPSGMYCHGLAEQQSPSLND